MSVSHVCEELTSALGAHGDGWKYVLKCRESGFENGKMKVLAEKHWLLHRRGDDVGVWLFKTGVGVGMEVRAGEGSAEYDARMEAFRLNNPMAHGTVVPRGRTKALLPGVVAELYDRAMPLPPGEPQRVLEFRRAARHCCAVCGQPGAKKCGRCMKARYCGSDCQRADWASHKTVCHEGA